MGTADCLQPIVLDTLSGVITGEFSWSVGHVSPQAVILLHLYVNRSPPGVLPFRSQGTHEMVTTNPHG